MSNLSNLVVSRVTSYEKKIETLGQYMGICKEVIVDSAAKLSKSFEKIVIWLTLPQSANSSSLLTPLLWGEEVLDFYRTRFLIEFCYRDAKNSRPYGVLDQRPMET